MVFAHDTEAALLSAAALVNTCASPGVDELDSRAGLEEFVATYGWSGTVHEDASELDAVRALRPRLRALWDAPTDRLVGGVNALLRENGAMPRLVAHDGWGYHLHATPDDAPLGARMAVEAAMALVDVVRSDELDRLRVCDAEDCDGVLADLSRNRSRRWCSTACANRVNVAAFRARQHA